MANLWQLRQTGNNTLPILVRNGGSLNTSTDSNLANLSPSRLYNNNDSSQDIIDVVNNFSWTKSPKTSRTDVPYALLSEKRLLVNSNVSNLANSFFASKDTVVSALATANQTSLANKINGFGQTSSVASLQDYASYLQKSSSPVAQTIGGVLQKFAEVQSGYTLGNPILQPYEFLYATEDTGFVYKFPYFTNSYTDSRLSFDGSSDNFLTEGVKIADNFATALANIGNTFKPGTYIERSKQYSMGQTGRTIELKFPLLNTGSFEHVLQNWQLIYGLIYQNRPGRVTKSIIDLPVIYQVQIPGVVFMPYAFISNLSVEFLGSRRLMNINVPIDGVASLETIIPDAYQLNITIEGLNEETKNFLYAGLQNNPVTVDDPIS